MPKAPTTPERAQVEIEPKPKTPQEQAAAELLKRLEKPIQPPPISETLEKAKLAMDQAKKAKSKIVKTWYCTECGDAHIQLHLDGVNSGHFAVDLEDDVPVNPQSHEPIAAQNKKSMDLARAKSGK
jgi:uncharacterized protein YlaI